MWGTVKWKRLPHRELVLVFFQVKKAPLIGNLFLFVSNSKRLPSSGWWSRNILSPKAPTWEYTISGTYVRGSWGIQGPVWTCPHHVIGKSSLHTYIWRVMSIAAAVWHELHCGLNHCFFSSGLVSAVVWIVRSLLAFVCKYFCLCRHCR